jgi:hypothetical protein
MRAHSRKMERSSAAGSQVSALKDPVADVGSALSQLGQALLKAAAARASEQIGEWTNKLSSTAKAAGSAEGVALAAGAASLSGRNPLWAMVKGAWTGASARQKTLMVLVGILVVVLLPVALLVLLLGLGYLGIRSAVT